MDKGLGREVVCQKEKIYTRHSFFDHLQSAIHGAPIRRCRVLVFLAS